MHWRIKEKYNQIRTITISFPAAFLKALVHLTLRGFRFILTRELENMIQPKKWTIILLEILMASVYNIAVSKTYWDKGKYHIL